ncbi:unnamed protein product [Haemonchus placei]|uniref:Reverse transcriptase domain-containing protein n=1 Tax=Haemonchus placei TaxID=6290 RepID=A0A0N4VSN7_HAEPC|nr:unnamed protein product [Haemonchus placei]
MDTIEKENMDEPPNIILFSDDIALTATSREEIQGKLQEWQGKLAENGHQLNIKKTKISSFEQYTESIKHCLVEASRER